MRYLIAALLATACAPDDTSSRDYSLTACPPPWGAEAGDVFARRTVCDRGARETPRFVTQAACEAEVNPRPRYAAATLNSTHSAYDQCLRTVTLVTIDDVRALVYETGR